MIITRRLYSAHIPELEYGGSSVLLELSALKGFQIRREKDFFASYNLSSAVPHPHDKVLLIFHVVICKEKEILRIEMDAR